MTTTGAQSRRKGRNRGQTASRQSPRLVEWFTSLTWRGVLLLSATCFVIGYPTYLWVYQTVTGGITHHGDLDVVDLKAMSSFEMDQVNGTTSDIPARFRALDGRRVRLTGQMYDAFQSGGKIHSFSLVYSINNCCFNGPPKIQHFVLASVIGPKPVEYYSDGFVVVTGTLHVGVEQGEKQIQSVYRIDVDKVERD